MRNLEFKKVEEVVLDIISRKSVRSIRDASLYFRLSETRIRDIYNYLRKYNVIYSVYRKGYYLNEIYISLFHMSKIKEHRLTSENYHLFITNHGVKITINGSYVNSLFSPKEVKDVILKMLEIDIEYALYNKYLVTQNELKVERYGVYDDYVVTQIIYKRTDNVQWFL